MSEKEEKLPIEDNEDPVKEEEEASVDVPSLFHNYISFTGTAIAFASFASIVLLFMIEFTSSTDQPYLGILTYVLLPSVLIFGLFIIFVGILFERRRRRKLTPEQIAAYPILDLNGPRRRRAFFVFMACSILFLCMSAFGSYRAYEFSESVTFCGETCHTVMKPEFVAYNASPHARVLCVECHVGGGAESYVRSKFSGVRQLYGVLTDNYNKPIKTPVHNMRAANETCAKCHWPNKDYGDQLKVFNHYGFDENNTLNQSRLLIKVGGGDPVVGNASGIHWHMNLKNEITFVASDERRENIVQVSMRDGDGKTVEYTAKDSPLSSQDIKNRPKRKMDCIDCHNRAAHVFVPPTNAVDNAMTDGSIDPSLPFIKSKAIEVLIKDYKTNEEAIGAISSALNDYYRTNYADVYNTRRVSLNSAIVATQRIYSTYFFPEMKTNWSSHPDNIGHLTTQGCFRCHNSNMVSPQGVAIRSDCNICHITMDQTFNGKTIQAENGEYRHPVDLGDMSKVQCSTCHTGDRAFKHPLNLGDISKFQCAECHNNGYDKIDVKNLVSLSTNVLKRASR